jgi:hypothetical protein
MSSNKDKTCLRTRTFVDCPRTRTVVNKGVQHDHPATDLLSSPLTASSTAHRSSRMDSSRRRQRSSSLDARRVHQ